MKKTILFIALLFNVIISSAQLANYYEDVYVNDSGGIDMANAYYAYDGASFYYDISMRMDALLVMYENTGNTYYLDRFLWNANRTLNRRDDNRSGIIPIPEATSVEYDPIDPYDGTTLNKVWSTRYYNKGCPRYEGFGGDDDWHKNTHAPTRQYTSCPECKDVPHLIGNANIIYAFTKFYNIIKDADTAIQDTNFNHFGQSENLSYTYLQIADDLLDASEATYTYFNTFWETALGVGGNTIGYYREHNGANAFLAFKGARLPMNMQASMGRAFVQLYEATDNSEYLDKAKLLADYIKEYTKVVADAKQWTYWGYVDPTPTASLPTGITDPEHPDIARDGDPLREDISHAALTAAFAYECVEYNIASTFTATDIQQYANTFLNDIFIDVLELDDGVDNGYTVNNTWNFKDNTNTHPYDSGLPLTEAPNGYLYDYWMLYASVDARIHQMLTDFNTTNYYPTLNSTDNFSRNLRRGLTIAFLHKTQQLFAPIASEHKYATDINWSGVDSGNFYDDPTEEFVYANNKEGTIRIGTITSDNKIKDDIITPFSHVSSFDWGNLAAGDFYGDEKDEIVIVSNEVGKNGYYIYSISAGNIVQDTEAIGWGAASDWVGAAAGNFDNTDREDFVLARNYNQEIRLFTHDATGARTARSTISLKALLEIPANATITGIASGNVIDNILGDELVVLVNSPDYLTNGYYVLSLNTSTYQFEVKSQNTGWGTGHDWQALTVGDYDGDGKDNIIMHGNYESKYKVYHVNESGSTYTIGALGSETFHKKQIEGNILGSGNFNAETNNDELIALRNTDGGIIVYTYNDRSFIASRATNSSDNTGQFVQNQSTTINDIKIYPNPTKGILTINVTNDISNIQINNLIGETIKTNIKKNTIDISSLSKGIYILTIELTNGNIITKKIIKN